MEREEGSSIFELAMIIYDTMQDILQNLSNDFFLYNQSSDIERMIENGFIDKGAIANKWLGYSSATEQAIALKEQQLGVILPLSYKNFLLASNGFNFISVFLDNLLPIEKIDWAIKIENRDWLVYNFGIGVTDEEYFCYNDKQDPAKYRHEYLKKSLRVSNWYDGMCVFLNPIIKHGNEWEVLEYASWHPGTRRYRSFEEFLHKTHENNLKLIEDNSCTEQ